MSIKYFTIVCLMILENTEIVFFRNCVICVHTLHVDLDV